MSIGERLEGERPPIFILAAFKPALRLRQILKVNLRAFEEGLEEHAIKPTSSREPLLPCPQERETER